MKRKIGLDGSCGLYGNGYEDILHTIRDCPTTNNIWTQIIPVDKLNSFFSGDLHDWAIANLQNNFRFQLEEVPLSASPMLGNWIQLNSDGVVKEDFGFAIVKRILRDRYNRWILGYNRFVGICSILDVELWDILKGFVIAINRGFDRIFILLDSQKA
ncbi:hypothetical protein Goklo_028609, partial [Gossypium klotzschianum]|nr:hypothetical protein [Gossypium klotzschianum]